MTLGFMKQSRKVITLSEILESWTRQKNTLAKELMWLS